MRPSWIQYCSFRIPVNLRGRTTPSVELAHGAAVLTRWRRGALAADLGGGGALRGRTGSEARELGLCLPAPERDRLAPSRPRAPALPRRRPRPAEADARAQRPVPGRL